MKKIVFLALTAVFIFSACSMGGTQIEKMSLEEAKIFATDFIDSNLLKSGDKSSIKEVVEENGIYNVVLEHVSEDGGQNYLQPILISSGQRQPLLVRCRLRGVIRFLLS